jgi:Tol biopolymer transport system component
LRRWIQINGILFAVCTMSLFIALLIGGLMPYGAGQITFASERDADLDIYLLDIGRNFLINLTHTPYHEMQAAWSPDGSRLVFVSNRDGNNELYVMDVHCPGWFAACAPVRRLTTYNGADFDPAWSPDGETIIYASEQVGYDIFAIPATGGAPQALTENSLLDANPAWSPDGQFIIFSSDRDRQWLTDLYRMDADGEHVERVIENEENDFSPAWSPDGHHLLYVTGGQAGSQMVMLDLESDEQTYLLDHSGEDNTPAWSPDSNSIVFISYREDNNAEVYILRLDCDPATQACLRRLTFTFAVELQPRYRPQE